MTQLLAAFKELIAHQFDAAFGMLNTCVVQCPDAVWDAGVGKNPFCQVAFHTLFFADYYLGPDEEAFARQPFHRDNQDFFADYEQLEDREPAAFYERTPIGAYLMHCRHKAAQTLANETAESLVAPARFARRDFARAELHVFNVRHIQHHTAQLSLRLRLDAGVEIPWIGSGWREF